MHTGSVGLQAGVGPRWSTASYRARRSAAGRLVCPLRSPLPLRRRVAAAASGDPSDSEEEAPPQLEEDVRDFRAKLIAQQRAAEGGEESNATAGTGAVAGEGWAYETPLIEQGSILLGGTQQKFGFALRQQYFHKCMLLLLQHDALFTKGIILNRPTALKIEGWDVWFGGDVQEGGMFRDTKGRQGELPSEMTCLHRLEKPEVQAVSKQVIKSIYSTPFESAKALVAAGTANKDDFWLFVGYCGWAPNQLQGELERDSWYMAAADSSVLLDELLSQAANPSALPRVDSTQALAPGGDGIATWERLMRNIGRVAEVDGTDSPTRSWVFDDSMLREWVRQKLTPETLGKPTGDPNLVQVETGTLLRSEDFLGFALERQFLHKSLLVLLEANSQLTVGVVLNRPTSTVAQLAVGEGSGEFVRRICYGGDETVEGRDVFVCLIPSQYGGEGSQPLGRSGLSRLGKTVPTDEQCGKLLVVRGFVYWENDELEKQIAEGRYQVVQTEDVPWDELWELSANPTITGEMSGGWTTAALGGTVWEKCGQHSSANTLLGPGLADLALIEWAKFFAE